MTDHDATLWTRMKHKLRSRVLGGLLVLVPLAITVLILKFLFSIAANLLAPIVLYCMAGVFEVPKAPPAASQPIAAQVAPAQDVPASQPGVGGAEAARPAVSPEVEALRTEVVQLTAEVRKQNEPVKDMTYLERAAIGAISILALVLLLYILGLAAAHVIGRKLLTGGEGLLMRLPLVKSIYSASKQVVQAVSTPNRMAFKSVVAVEYFRPGYMTLGFMTGTVQVGGYLYCKLFVPTTPNPTTGFYIMARSENVMETHLTVEEGFKIIISGGIICPEMIKTKMISVNVPTNESLADKTPLRQDA